MNLTPSSLDLRIVEQWLGKTVFVIGDVMLDKFVYGQAERLSPEAPIPVLHFHREEPMLGGAANVARNVIALGGNAILAGVVGNDKEGDIILGALLPNDGIRSLVVRSTDTPTITKTRFICGSQQIMRLDVEKRLEMTEELEAAVLSGFLEVVDQIDVVVLSDYAKGLLSDSIVKKVIHEARERNLPVVVDPKTRDASKYAGATVLTPNALEAAMITGSKCDTDQAAEEATIEVLKRGKVSSVVLTRGSQGMTIFSPGSDAEKPLHLPANAREVYDVSGAGDTVVATLALALAAPCGVTEAAKLANLAAGIAVSKRGTSVISPYELRRAAKLGEQGYATIVDWADAAEVVAGWQRDGLKVGFTNGCYDLLHPGHVQLLRKAKSECDRLVVALNSDSSVRRLKGPGRPVQSETARATVMGSISSVDLVIMFEEDTPLSLIQMLRPDVLIKGADYTAETVVGADLVIGNGGRLVLVPIEQGHSTTSIISRSRDKTGT